MTHQFASAVFSLDGFENVPEDGFVVQVDTRRAPLQELQYQVKVVQVDTRRALLQELLQYQVNVVQVQGNLQPLLEPVLGTL
jgi:hypothetical protein